MPPTVALVPRKQAQRYQEKKPVCTRSACNVLGIDKDSHRGRVKLGLNGNQSSGVCAIRSGINGSSVSLVTSEYGSPHVLSEYACRQFQKHIILPIIRESSLKDFHPLVAGIPHRVGRKEITCLRDLEKVLLWLAPVSDLCPLWDLWEGV